MSNKVWNTLWNTGILEAPLQNGIGRYVCQLQRVTLKFCKTDGGSKGMRDFIENDLIDFSKQFPGVAVYVKPRRHHRPHLKAEYLNGGTLHIQTHKLGKDDIRKWLEHLRTRSGYPDKHVRRNQHTFHPSTQGVWSPWTNADPELNLATYPYEDMRSILHPDRTGTDELLEIFQKQLKVQGTTSDEDLKVLKSTTQGKSSED